MPAPHRVRPPVGSAIATGSTAKSGDAAKGVRRGEAIRELKKRDNSTNFGHIAFVYLVIVASIAVTIWSYRLVADGRSRLVVEHPDDASSRSRWSGASQHQFGGVIHEGTHFILFENKTSMSLLRIGWPHSRSIPRHSISACITSRIISSSTIRYAIRISRSFMTAATISIFRLRMSKCCRRC